MRIRKHITRWILILAILVTAFYLTAVSAGYFLKKYLVEHSEEWTGRKIAIGSIFIHPFKFAISINDFQAFEAKSDSVFLSFNELYLNGVIRPLFSQKLVFEEVVLTEPRVHIFMKGESFNFDDLLQRFFPDNAVTDSSSVGQSYSYRVEKIELVHGQIDLYHATFGGGLSFDKINAFLPLVSSDQPEIAGTLAWSATTGGLFKSAFNIHRDNLNYNLQLSGKAMNVHFLLPFLDKFMYLSDIQGKIDTDLILGGRFDAPVSEANGFIRLTEFQLLDTLQKPSVKLNRFEIQFDTVSAMKGDYVIRHVLIDSPYLAFNLTPYGNSLMQAFPSYGDTATTENTIGDTLLTKPVTVKEEYVNFFSLLNKYFIDLGQAYAVNYYAIDSLQITGGNFEFGDHTLDKQFNFLFEDLSIRATKLNSDQDSVKIIMESKLNRSGVLNADLVLLPKDTGDLKLSYSINELNISDFSPYSEYYVAHPFWDGVVYFTSATSIRDSQLESKNHILIKHLEVGDKVANKTSTNLPLKLAVSLLKDVRGDVNFTIPVKGDLNDPKFRVGAIILKILKDLILKAVAAPYKLLVRTFKADEDDLRDIKYDYLQFDIQKRQSKALNMLARVLNQKKELHAELVHLTNPDWEKNQYALFEAKRQFYIEVQHKTELTYNDSMAIDQIQRLDTAFVQFIKQKSGSEVISDIETACVNLVGQDKISQLVEDLGERRLSLLNRYLADKIKVSNRYSVREAEQKEKSAYRDRPKFLIRFDATSDSVSKK